MSSHSGVGNGKSAVPRAMIHKKILDAAESEPSASVERLAAAVNGASADLVERVLEEYGDPAESEGTTGGSEHDANEDQPDMKHAQTNENGGVDAQDVHEPSDPPTLTVKQREALRAIRASPEATQGELAEQFGVTQSTINNRLNSIEGFDWKRRLAFAESVLGDESPVEPDAHAESEATVDGAGETERDDTMKSDGGDTVEAETDDASESDTGEPSDAHPPESERAVLTRLEDLSARVAVLEGRVDDASPANVDEPSPLGEPDLACKVVRACFDSPDITEAEEDRILKAVIASGGRS